MKINTLSFMLMAFLSSCGYRLQDTGFETQTISVPFIKGDIDGLFTSALIRELTTSGNFSYVNQGGALLLEIKILQDEKAQIGYRYDREDASGEIIKRLEPVEGRRSMIAEVKLVDNQTLNVIVGPFKVKACADYDFVDVDSITDVSFVDPSGSRKSVLDFSLGQLDSEDGAFDASRYPLYKKLSNSIVEALIPWKKNN